MGEQKVFDQNEYSTLKAFAEVIIPSGDDPQEDPGANDTHVVDFIDKLLCDDKLQLQGSIKKYLKELNQATLKDNNKSFSELSKKSREAIARKFAKKNFKSFAWLRRFVMSSFYSNYRPMEYEGRTAWETIGYLGPMTWPEMTWSMSNPAYSKEQEDKEAVQL